MPQLTFEECKKAHVEIWKWLSENPEKAKQEWPGWEDNFDRISMDKNDHYYACPGGIYNSIFIPYHCFACYWACGDKRMNNDTAFESRSILLRDCRKCPLEWYEECGSYVAPEAPEDTVCTERTEFDRWLDAKHFGSKRQIKKERKELADQIANKEWTDKFTVQNADISHED